MQTNPKSRKSKQNQKLLSCKTFPFTILSAVGDRYWERLLVGESQEWGSLCWIIGLHKRTPDSVYNFKRLPLDFEPCMLKVQHWYVDTPQNIGQHGSWWWCLTNRNLTWKTAGWLSNSLFNRLSGDNSSHLCWWQWSLSLHLIYRKPSQNHLPRSIIIITILKLMTRMIVKKIIMGHLDTQLDLVNPKPGLWPGRSLKLAITGAVRA